MRQLRSARAMRSLRIVLPSAAVRELSFCIVVLPLLPLLVPVALVLPSRCMRSVEEVPMLPVLPVPVAVESWLRCVGVPEFGVIVDEGLDICPSRCIVP